MKTITRAVATGAMLLALQACTNLGPDYQEPEVDWLAEWETDLYGQALTSEQQAELDPYRGRCLGWFLPTRLAACHNRFSG